MALFWIKKAFFDFWDHFLAVILLNLGFIAVAAIAFVLAPEIQPAAPVLGVIILLAGVALLFVYGAAVAMSARDITDYHSLQWSSMLEYLRELWPAGLVYAAMMIGSLFLLTIAIPTYAAMNNLFGTAALALLFWAAVIWYAGLQFFLPVRTRLDRNFKKIIKKSFLVLFDNPLYALGSAVGFVLIVGVSVFTAFLLPGPAGAVIWLQAGFKLRLLKYDYLEEHPDADRRRIPWDRLLVDDRERVGKRTFKGMIFPWKE
ncbi:MAG: hypothetical protein ACLFPO_03725 [Spirochaetaceae bacterium]